MSSLPTHWWRRVKINGLILMCRDYPKTLWLQVKIRHLFACMSLSLCLCHPWFSSRRSHPTLTNCSLMTLLTTLVFLKVAAGADVSFSAIRVAMIKHNRNRRDGTGRGAVTPVSVFNNSLAAIKAVRASTVNTGCGLCVCVCVCMLPSQALQKVLLHTYGH